MIYVDAEVMSMGGTGRIPMETDLYNICFEVVKSITDILHIIDACPEKDEILFLVVAGLRMGGPFSEGIRLMNARVYI